MPYTTYNSETSTDIELDVTSDMYIDEIKQTFLNMTSLTIRAENCSLLFSEHTLFDKIIYLDIDSNNSCFHHFSSWFPNLETLIIRTEYTHFDFPNTLRLLQYSDTMITDQEKIDYLKIDTLVYVN